MFSNFLGIVLSASSESGGMFSRGWMEWGGIFTDLFMTILWQIITCLMQLIYTVEKAFYWLAGVKSDIVTSKGNLATLFPSLIVDNETGMLTGQIDYGIIFGKEDPTTHIYSGFNTNILDTTLIMLAIGCGMVAFFLVFAIIKGLFNNEGKTEVMIKSATWNTVKACCFMAVAPLFIVIAISTISWFISLVFNGISSALVGSSGCSIAETILNSIYTGPLNSKNNIVSGSNEYSSFCKMIVSNGGTNDDGSWNIWIQFFDLETLVKGNATKDASINWSLNGDVNYSIGFIGGAFTLVALGLMLIRIGERLYNLIIDYILCIPSIATMPYDNGQRFSTWGQLFLGQLLNFTGSVVAMIVYLYMTKTVCGVVNKISGDHTTLFKAVVNIVVIIGGAFTCVKAGTIVSQLIGQVASQQENNSLQQSMHLASMGARATKTIAGAGAMAFGVGAMGTLKAMKQQQGTGNGTNGTKGGTGTGGTSGGIGGAINNLAGGGDTPTGNGGGTSGGTGAGGDTPSSKANVGDKLSGANTTSTGESSPLSAVGDELTGAMATSGAGDIANQVADSGINTVAKSTRKSAFDKTMKTIGNGIKGLNSGVARGFVESARSSHMNPFAIAVGTASAFAGGLVAMTLKGVGFATKKGVQAVNNKTTWGKRRKYTKQMKNTEKSLMNRDLDKLSAMKGEDKAFLKKAHKQKVKEIKKDSSLSDDEKELKIMGVNARFEKEKKDNKNIYKYAKNDIKKDYKEQIRLMKGAIKDKNSEGKQNHATRYVKNHIAEENGEKYANMKHTGLDVASVVNKHKQKENK